MKKIWHNHNKWEEVKYGMYMPYNIKHKNELTQQVINFFMQPSLVKKCMIYVIDNFKYSCEHNFTNPSMNHIAWLGQASVAYYLRIPEEITRIAWNFLDEQTQNKANKIAEEQIKRWFESQKNI